MKAAPSRFGEHDASDARIAMLAGLAVVIAAAAIMVAFHDKFWWPPDDGAYAYVAQRILRGDVLNGNIQDVHAGYVHFIHAAAMALFGEDIVSLRYPLAFLTIVQAALAYLLLLPRGRPIAFAAGVSAAALSFVLFLNPSANWYALAMAFVVAGVLAWTKPGDRWRLVSIGALLASTVLLRQLSGVFLAMGALTWLLVEKQPASAGPPRLARALILVMGIGLAGYLVSKQSVTGAILFGFAPAALLVLAWRAAALADGACLKAVRDLLLGAAAATCPLVIYHLHHGTLASWLTDVVATAFALTALDFIPEASYGRMFVQVLALARDGAAASELASLIFWCVLLAAPLALGVLSLRRVAADKGFGTIGPLPVVAAFFGMVSVHYEIPIYLTYASALTFIALMSLAETRQGKAIVTMIAAFLCAVALSLHAAEPMSRTLRGILLGTNVDLSARDGLPRARIAMERADQEAYSEILDLIARNSAPADTILALPFNPEFYFLSDRRAPFRYFIASLGLVSAADYERALAAIRETPPKVVIFRRDDKYNSPLTLRLIERIKGEYTAERPVAGFEVFIRRN